MFALSECVCIESINRTVHLQLFSDIFFLNLPQFWGSYVTIFEDCHIQAHIFFYIKTYIYFCHNSSPPNRTENMRTIQIHKGTGRVISTCRMCIFKCKVLQTSSQSSYSNSWKNSPPELFKHSFKLDIEYFSLLFIYFFVSVLYLADILNFFHNEMFN